MYYLIVVQHIHLSPKNLPRLQNSLPDHLVEGYRVRALGGKVLLSDSIYQECKSEIFEQELKADLIKL